MKAGPDLSFLEWRISPADAPVIVAGHSHMCALVGDMNTQQNGLHAVPNVPDVLAYHGAWPRSDTYWKDLVAASSDSRVALVWNGNEHNVLYFFQSDLEFDFMSRHVGKLMRAFQLIPVRTIRQKFKELSLDELSRLVPVLVSSGARRVALVGTPPPKKDSEALRQLFQQEPHFVAWARHLGEDVDKIRITPPHIRLKLWHLLQDMIQEIAVESGATFVPVPSEAKDDEGFLRPEYWRPDVTHANDLYGQIMLRAVLRELSSK